MGSVPTPVNPQPTAQFLYRLRDADGVLLYVGVTNDWPSRFKQHSRDKAWFPQVATTEIVPVGGNRAQLEAIEKAVIVAEKPRHNVMHNEARRLTLPAVPRIAAELSAEDEPRFKVGDHVRTMGGYKVGTIEQRIRSINHVQFPDQDYLWELCDNELVAVPSFEDFTGRKQGEKFSVSAGDKIEHSVFGKGVVIEVRGWGDKEELTARFPCSVGTKHLSVIWAPIRMVGA